MLIEDYISYIGNVRRYSPRTQEIYSDSLRLFREYSEAPDDASLLEALVPSLLRSFEVHLLDACKLDPRTVNLHLSVLSGFCRYLVRGGHLASNPVRLISRPKMEKRLPSFYREESMEEYFDKTAGAASEENMELLAGDDKLSRELFRKRMDRLIVSVLYSTAMRRSELIGLRVGDIDFSRNTIRVRGKGDKEREIPMVEALCEEISLYLRTVETMEGRARSAQDALFLTGKGSELYPGYVDRVVRSQLDQVSSITGKKSPHVLRHSLATELLNEGTDLNSIKELLGHSSLAATQVYTHNSIEKLKKVYINAHPRAKSGGKNGD